jgi:hypothetical protein
MSKSFSARLLAALDKHPIPAPIKREIHNDVCGVNASNPHSVAWDVLYHDVQKYLSSLRSNKDKVRPDLRRAWQSYYDTISVLPALIRDADQTQPLVPPRDRWQGWIDTETRKRHCLEFELVYTAKPTNGRRIVPFAPDSLRRDSFERIDRCRTALLAARSAWNTQGTPKHPKADTHLGAVILAATFQAERALRSYEAGLKSYMIHPYDTPAKANWQHYCEASTREKVRRLTANPGDMFFEFNPYRPYYFVPT